MQTTMPRAAASLLILCLAGLVAGGCTGGTGDGATTTDAAPQVMGSSSVGEDDSLWDAVAAYRTLSTFATIVTAAGLSEQLADQEAEVTVVALPNAALDVFGVEQVQRLVNPSRPGPARRFVGQLIIAGAFTTDDLSDGQELLNIDGDPVAVRRTADGWQIGEWVLQQTDLRFENGILHVARPHVTMRD